MDEDAFNLELRKFLKQVGVTSQRAIEQAVRKAMDRGTLTDKTELKARMTLDIEELGLTHTVEDRISLLGDK